MSSNLETNVPGPEDSTEEINSTSLLDTLRVLTNVVVPTIAKGVIKRRPSVEALAQHHGLDTKALELLQDLRRRYGDDPLQLNVLIRSQVLVLNPQHVEQVLNNTPIPFQSASMEKKSALRHFEPSNILISSPEQRAVLRPIHEHALATKSRIHPLASHFSSVIASELTSLISSSGSSDGKEVNWTDFSTAWSKITLSIVLGPSARDDKDLIDDLDYIRKNANWGFLAPFTDTARLEAYQTRVSKYISNPAPDSLVSRLPSDPQKEGVELPSQVAQWLFAFDAAAMATIRALALLATHPQAQEQAVGEAKGGEGENEKPLTRAVLLESLRLWPTTPVILRESTDDTEIGGKAVKKGTGVAVFAPFFHRDSEKLAYANRLNTDLWVENDKDLVLERERAFIPFSAGPAMCPAHNLVPMVCSLVMCAIVKDRRIELVKPRLDVENLPGTLNNFDVVLRLSERPS